MKKVVLALAVLLTAASVSFAGYTPVLTEVDNGNPDFTTYIVSLMVDEVSGITSISDVTVTGAVQVWSQLGSDPVTMTPGPLDPATNKFVFDTRLLDLSKYSTNSADPVLVNGSWSETNGGTNPIAIDPDYGGYLVYTSGYGDLGPTDPGSESSMAVKSPAANMMVAGATMDILQICIPSEYVYVPTGGSITVNGLYTNADRAEDKLPMIPFEFGFEVPEPSTIIMLVMGALCLVGYRLRRK